MLTLDFCPRRGLVERLEAGWRLIPDHDYRPDEWAILVMLPAAAAPMTAAEIRSAAAVFFGRKRGRRPRIPNTRAAANSRDAMRSAAKRRATMQATRRET